MRDEANAKGVRIKAADVRVERKDAYTERYSRGMSGNLRLYRVVNQ